MKKSSLAAFVLTLTAASMSVAQPPGGERGGREGGREGGRGPGGDAISMVDRMMEFDKDGDGKVSKDEAPERLQSMFARADKNEDGLLTKDEISAEIGTRTGGPEGGRGPEGGERPEGGRGGFGGGREGGGRGGFPGMGGPGMGGPPAIIAALDTDKDGELSAAEIDLAIVALKKLDRNKDGKLDRAELGMGGPEGRGPGDRRPEGRGPGMEGGPGGPGGPRGNMAEFMLERFDANKDGKLTGDEIPERMRENLDAVDTNKDKSIDKAELEAMSSRFQGGGPGGPGAPGGRGGFGGGRPGEGRPGEGGPGGERRRPAIED